MYQPSKIADLLEAPVKVDPFSLEALIAWLRTKPADEIYNWHGCNGECLLGQYMSKIGFGRSYTHFVAEWELRTGFDAQAVASAYRDKSFPFSTFGKALSRALSLQANT